MSFVDSLAYRILGNALHRREDSFASFKTKLRQAHYPVTFSQYLASAALYSLSGGFFAGILGSLLGWKILSDPENLLSSFIEVRWPGFIAEQLYLNVAFLGVLLFLAGFLVFFTLAYSLPYFQADIRKSCIDRSLLPAVTYMYALTMGGMPLFAVFRSITRHNLIFGGSAGEIRYIVRDMDYLGKDIISALETAKARTPSEHFKDFLEGLIFVSASGNVKEYLDNKTSQYQELAELASKDYLKKLDVLAEIYVTVLVAGPLFLMTTLIVLQFFRSSSVQVLYMLIYVIIPLATLLYIVLLDTIGELSLNPEKISISLPTLNLADVPEKKSEEDEEKLIKKIDFHAKAYRLKKVVFNPFQTLLSKPAYTFLLGMPAGILYLAYIPKIFSAGGGSWLSGFSQIAEGNIELIAWIDDYVIIFILIVLIPFIVFYELQARRGRQIDKQMPEFLKNLASMNASGILLSNALKMMADSKLGVLSKELKKVREDISWGTSTSAALLKLESTVRTATASKILHTLVRANESTSDLKSVLSITSEQVKSEEKMKKERASQMVVYIFTIYVSFGVFLFIVYVLSVYFFPESVAFKGSSGGIANASFNVEEYTMLMYHSSVVQGLCSGLIAGKMGHGSTYLGLKYSASMMIIAYIVFNFFV